MPRGGRKKLLALPADASIGKQVVFRTKNPLTEPKAPRESQRRNDNSQSTEPVNHSRKKHRKSRTGCSNCKQRRIKCDETRPQCQRCESYGVDCDYSASPAPPSTGQPVPASHALMNSSSPEVSRYIQSMSMADIASQIDQVLDNAPAVDVESTFLPNAARTQSYAVLYHFINLLSDNGFPASASLRRVIRGEMLRLAFQTPHLMHSVLGVATFHLAAFLPDPDCNRLAQAHHLSCAINLYQRELRSNINRNTMDGLMSTCMLLANSAFLEEKYPPSKSFVFSSDPTALNWLRLQSGMQHILPYTGQYLDQSIWFVPFMEIHYEPPILDDDGPGQDEPHPKLAELCEVNEFSTKENNPYLSPLRILTPILKTEVNSDNFLKITTFMGRIKPDFIALLQRKEPKALLVFAFWLGKMCEYKANWMYLKFHTECTAICMFLENNSDPRVLELLTYPAQMCSYLLGCDSEGAMGG